MKIKGTFPYLLILIVIFLALPVSPVVAQQGDEPPGNASSTPTGEEATEEPVEALQSPTEEPTGTSTATPSCEDSFEPNNMPGSGSVLMPDQPISGLTLTPTGDVDYFQIWIKADRYYRVGTATTDGVDTRLRIFNDAGDLLAENDDFRPGDPASRVQFQAPTDSWLFVAVDSVVPIEWGCRLYNISMTEVAAPTPTNTPTPTPTGTATPDPNCEDSLEPNNEPGSGPVLISGQPLSGLTLRPQGDVDYFQLWVKAARYYQVDTATTDGVDTRLRIFNDAGELLAENDDFITGDPSSRMKFQAPADGWLFVSVDSVSPIDWGCRRYNISMVDVSAPTPTPTPTPEPTQTPAPTQPASTLAPSTPLPEDFDAYEPNYDFATAAGIGVNQVAELNFHIYPPGAEGIDNDFFKLYVKVGQILEIETTELAPGVDTNLIVYREDTTTVVVGNDDCGPGELRSCLEWQPDYTGYAYVLVGPVGLTAKSISADSLAYKLSIKDLAGQPTPTPAAPGGGYGEPLPWDSGPGAGEATAEPEPASTATPTPTPEPQLQLRTFSLAPPTPTPLPLQPVVIDLTVYYDENDNDAPDVNEGITGINLQILDSLTNQILGQAFTNNEGHATVFTSAADEVRLSVPYLGYSQEIRPPGTQLLIRIPPLHIPSIIP